MSGWAFQMCICVSRKARMRENLNLHACIHNKCDCECVQAREKITCLLAYTYSTSDNGTHNLSLKLCLCTMAVCHGDIITHCAKYICQIIVFILKMACLSKAADGKAKTAAWWMCAAFAHHRQHISSSSPQIHLSFTSALQLDQKNEK